MKIKKRQEQTREEKKGKEKKRKRLGKATPVGNNNGSLCMQAVVRLLSVALVVTPHEMGEC